MYKGIKIASLTPVYNSGKYFEECLDGLLGQTIRPNEIVVIDDASTDNSVETVKNIIEKNFKQLVDKNSDGFSVYSANNVKISFKRLEQNLGPAGARNAGLKYILNRGYGVTCIADSDDVYYPTKIEKSVNILLNNKQVALVYSDYDIYDERTNTLAREYKEPFAFNRLASECIVSNNSVIANSILKNVGLYDERLRGPEDYDMWLRISEQALVYHIPESLYKYRVSGNNITITTPKSAFASQVQFVHQKMVERLNEKRATR